MTFKFSKFIRKLLRNPCRYSDQSSHIVAPWPPKYAVGQFSNSTSGLGVSPQKRKKNEIFFDLVLTPTEVHLVDHVSPEG